jgi:hypothetical protein
MAGQHYGTGWIGLGDVILAVEGEKSSHLMICKVLCVIVNPEKKSN